jgi:hypothetical protein
VNKIIKVFFSMIRFLNDHVSFLYSGLKLYLRQLHMQNELANNSMND